MRKILISSLFIATSIIAFSLLAFTGIFFGTDSSKPTELHRAAERNDFVTIRKWIEDGRNLDVTYNEPGNMHSGSGIHGYTALMFAAENRRLEAVKLLVNGGANIYLETSRPQREGYEYSVFDFAVKGGDPETVKFLWEISDKKSFRKRTPTNLRIAYDHFCSRRNKPAARELVVFFLENLTEKHLASEKLLSISYREYCIDAIRFLLDRGVAPTSTAVVAASRSGLPDIVSLYLRHGADINALGSALEANNIYAKVTPLIAAAAEAELKQLRFCYSREPIRTNKTRKVVQHLSRL